MKTLEQFWRWFDGERPDARAAHLKARWSELAREAMHRAAVAMRERKLGRPCASHPELATELMLEEHPDALRELSLSLCAALERMREQVPAAEKPRVHVWHSRPDSPVFDPQIAEGAIAEIQLNGETIYRRECLGELGVEASEPEEAAPEQVPEPRAPAQQQYRETMQAIADTLYYMVGVPRQEVEEVPYRIEPQAPWACDPQGTK